MQSEITNKSLNNIPVSQGETNTLLSASLGSGWIRLHPESLKNSPTPQKVFSSVSPNTIRGQVNAGLGWEATNWNGVCDELAKIAKPTLVITGTDDNLYQPHGNSLILAEKIPGAWLVQSKMLVMQYQHSIQTKSIKYYKHFSRPQQGDEHIIWDVRLDSQVREILTTN